MKLSLRPAGDEDRAFCESLNRDNMRMYMAARGIAWDGQRFLASWHGFENQLIVAGPEVVGLLRLLPEQDALGVRDLQVVPEHQGRGIGTWALQRAQAIAVGRGFRRLQLRVYEENPARELYARLGFRTQRIDAGNVHMALELPPRLAAGPTPLPGMASFDPKAT